MLRLLNYGKRVFTRRESMANNVATVICPRLWLLRQSLICCLLTAL